MSEYFRMISEPSLAEKRENWETAIGLQQVDGLVPSDYLIEVAKANIEGKLSFDEVEELLYKKHGEKPGNSADRTAESDLVSERIARYLSECTFRFTPVELNNIHAFLFKDIITDIHGKSTAGRFRDYNFTKDEPILNGKSVTYCDFRNIESYLEYDFSTQSEKALEKMSPSEFVKDISHFISNIWQIHPFPEGNTRTTALFAQCYLKSLGFSVDNTLFRDHSLYFRNALVRANYADIPNGLANDYTGLQAFFENLLFKGRHKLQNRNLIVTDAFEEQASDEKRDQEGSKGRRKSVKEKLEKAAARSKEFAGDEKKSVVRPAHRE